jgi:hypothetical protein
MNILARWMSLAVVALLAACGGGGDGGDEAPPPPALQSSATLTYTARNATDGMYDPWTPVLIEPTVTGVPAGTTMTFQVSNLPPGLAIDAATGLISGMADEEDAVISNVSVTMTAQGFTGSLFLIQPIRVHGISGITFFGGGFTFDERVLPTIFGSVGVPGTVDADAVMRTVVPNTGPLLGGPLPAGSTTTYGLDTVSSVPGGSMDPATGVFTWTPNRTGTFRLRWFADVSFKGVTRRVTSQDFRLIIS